MNIVISWTGLTGYTGDCWRALAALPDVRLKAYVEPTAADQEFRAERELAGLDARMLKRDEVPGKDVEDEVAAFAPDVVFVVGWRAKSCRWFAQNPKWTQAKKVLVCDMPFAWTPRKIAARVALAGYLRHFAAAFVPGETSARYMRWLGFGGRRPIFTGLHCTNLRRFDGLGSRAGRSVRRFLYVGRYSEEKGLDVLLAAYRRYRARVESPWGLDCVGTGHCADMLKGVDGVVDLGFKSPAELAEVYAAHDAFVLASRFEPWGLVLVEAAAAGLPIVCTDVCGAVGKAVCANGVVVRSGDVDAFADALERIHRMDDDARAEMGAQGRALVGEFSCEAWAERVRALCNCVIVEGGRCLKS